MNALIVIPKPRFHSYLPPLGYLYLSSVLKQIGIETKVVFSDAIAESSTLFAAWDMVITGTSYLFHNNCPSPTVATAIQVSTQAKKINPTCITVLVGPLNSILYENLLQNSFVDYVVLGEPEPPVRALGDALSQGRSTHAIPGIVRSDGGNIIMGEVSTYPELEALDFPDREAICFKNYIKDSYFASRTTTVLSSRGCPFSCTYCFGAAQSLRNKHNTGKVYRYASAEYVVDEILYLYNKWNVRGIKFVDVEFCIAKDRVHAICELLIKKSLPVKWRAVTRVTSIEPDLLRLMHRSGCRSIYYGVESGDENMLQRMNKKISLDQVRRVFADTWKSNIKPEAAFLFGAPGETAASINKTIQFAKEINPFLATFHAFVPFPGSLLEQRGVIPPVNDLDAWNVYNIDQNASYCELSPQEIHQLIKRAYTSIYTRPRFIVQLGASVNMNLLRFLTSSFIGKCEGSVVKNAIFGGRISGSKRRPL